MEITVAIDCMGGDHGPHVTVPAALKFLKSNSDVDVVLVGLPDRIEAAPKVRGATSVLDRGANVDCGPEHLLQFAIMGATLVAAVEHKDRPSVGLLNIGEEDIKGNEVVKKAAELLRDSEVNFIGNIEGDGIYK